MSFAGLEGCTGVDVQASAAETARFGLSFARLTAAATTPAEELRAAVEGAEADVLVARFPQGAAHLPGAAAAAGRDVVACSPLTYWRVPAGAARGAAAAGVDVVGGTELDVGPVLDEVVRASFAAYPNHYANDPLLDRTAALEGYVEWARGTAPEDVLVLRHRGEPVGIATLAAGDAPERHLEILLAGLVPTAQGQGWYGRLLQACGDLAAHRGCAAVVISTQADNVRVQRAWARAGFEPVACWATLHLVRRGLLP